MRHAACAACNMHQYRSGYTYARVKPRELNRQDNSLFERLFRRCSASAYRKPTMDVARTAQVCAKSRCEAQSATTRRRSSDSRALLTWRRPLQIACCGDAPSSPATSAHFTLGVELTIDDSRFLETESAPWQTAQQQQCTTKRWRCTWRACKHAAATCLRNFVFSASSSSSAERPAPSFTCRAYVRPRTAHPLRRAKLHVLPASSAPF